MKWISSEDTLPKLTHVYHDDEDPTVPDEYFSDTVLGYIPGKWSVTDENNSYATVYLIKGWAGKLQWLNANGDGECFALEDVTHWLPISAPGNTARPVLNVPFMKIKDASAAVGISQYALRAGCKNGTVPHVMSGKIYMINVPALRKELDKGVKIV